MSHSQATSEHSGLNGGKASDWLRPKICGLSLDFVPDCLLHLANDIHLERYPLGALRLHIPSRLEGKWGVVGKKAGGLADARHICILYIKLNLINSLD